MSPIRRYLRISRSAVLEVRVYPDPPSASTTNWLLNPPSPALPRVLEAVRPILFPKLQEERANAKKGRKRKGWKDTVICEGGDCEVSVFLTETSTRHTILKKVKALKEEEEGSAGVRREDSEDNDDVRLADVPTTVDVDEEDGLSNEEGKDDDVVFTQQNQRSDATTSESEDKKKLGMTTNYEGFAIYGRILCLVVKRKGGGKGSKVSEGIGAGQAMMEEWIASTQVAAEERTMDD